MVHEKVRTPCIGTCSTVFGDYVCRGCKRFLQEIIDWNSYSDDEKRAIQNRLDQLLTRVVAGKVEVCDMALFKLGLKRWKVQQSSQRPIEVAIFELLRAVGRRHESWPELGLKPMPQYRSQPPHMVKELIDREFFVLSEVYFERYIRGPIAPDAP